MTFYKAVQNALLAVLNWIGMFYTAFCDWVGISEWNVFFIILTIIGASIGIRKFWR